MIRFWVYFLIGYGLVMLGAILGDHAAHKRPALLPLPMADAEVLFVGDCQAWGWGYDGKDTWAKFRPKVQTLGLPSYQVGHLADDAYRLEGATAGVVVVQLGMADLSTGGSVSDIAEGYVEALEAVRAALPPLTRVLVLEIPEPTTNLERAEKTRRLNNLLRYELDYPRVWDRGYLIGEFVPMDVEPGADGVHLDARGYAQIRNELRGRLQ